MASTGINFSKITPDNGAIRDISELILREVAEPDSIGGQVNFLPAQKHGKKIGFVGEFGMLGKPATGCGTDYDHNLMNTIEKEWDIKRWQIKEEICYHDLEGTLAQSALRSGTAVEDLTGTDYIDKFAAPRLTTAVKKLINRIAWFGDKAASVYESSGNTNGTLKPGQKAENFTIADGLWKRVFAGVAGGTIKRVAVAANGKTSKAEQKTAIRAAGVASGIIEDLITEAPAVLRQMEGLRVYVSQALADALTLDVRHNNRGSELQWEALKAGISTTRYAGVEIVALPFWDEIIEGSLQNTENTAAADKPFRALLSVKDNLLVGSESDNEMAELVIGFDQRSGVNYIKVIDSIGTQIADDNLVVVAY